MYSFFKIFLAPLHDIYLQKCLTVDTVLVFLSSIVLQFITFYFLVGVEYQVGYL